MKRPSFLLLHDLVPLFGNHFDAWGVTFCITTICLAMHNALTPDHVILTLAITLTAWLAFAVNDYWDAPFDLQDGAKAQRNFFALRSIARPIIAVGGILVVGLVGLVLWPFGPVGIGGLGVCVFGIWAYSAPPLRLKSRPGFDLLTHAAFVQTGPYLAPLLLIRAVWRPVDVVLLILLFISSLSAQLEQQARDFALDSQMDTNFATRLGLAWTTRLLRLLSATLGVILLGGLIAGIFPLVLLPLPAAALPAVLHRFIRRERPRSERLVKSSVLLAVLYALVLWIVL
jgi:chlorophyll synthase